MKETLAVAVLNFKQGIREKIFVGIVFFLVFLLLVSLFMGILSVGETDKVVRSQGITGLEISGLLLLLFSFTLSYYREIESRILHVYLSYFAPGSYLTGKLLGYFLITAFYLLIGSIGWALILLLNNAFTWKIFPAVYLLLLKLTIVLAINLLLCTLFSSSVIALLGTLFIYYASEVAAQALKIVSASQNEMQKYLIEAVYYLLPNMAKLEVKSSIAHERIPDFFYIAWISGYSVLYLGFILSLAVYVFRRKEY